MARFDAKKFLEGFLEVVPELAKVGSIVGTAVVALNPTTSWAVALLLVSNALLAARVAQKMVPDKNMPDVLQTGTSGVLMQRTQAVTDTLDREQAAEARKN